MKPIDADELRKYWKISKECVECHWNNRDCSMPPYYSLFDICKAIDETPVIDAIPVEWIKALTNHSDLFTRGSAKWVLGCWKREQEAR